MSEYPISFLIGNPSLDEAEILDGYREDVREFPGTSAALPDSVGDEMAEAFGWDNPPTDEELERDHANRMCEEEGLLARYPGLLKRPDEYLIEQIADPLGFTDDADVARACAVILERRLSGALARVTA